MQTLDDLHLFPHAIVLPILILIVIRFLKLIRLSWWISAVKTKSRLPPSPPRLPILGNLHQLSSLPHRSLQALSNKYGPLMLLHFGQKPTLVVSSSELAREVMKSQDRIFANRPSLAVPTELLYGCKDIAFAPYCDYWRQVRKVGVLHLLNNKQVHSYQTLREEEVRHLIEQVAELSSRGAINLTEILNDFTLNNICRVAIGRRLDEGSWGGVTGKLIEEASFLLGDFHWGDYVPWLAWISKLNRLDARIKRSSQINNEFLESIIDERATKCMEGENAGGCTPFVDVLLSLEKELNGSFPFDKQNIKAILMDMLGAGTESIHVTLEWIMAELIRNSHVMAKLKQEIRGVVGSKPAVEQENLTNLCYLKAVIKETLRLHPPGPLLVPRESLHETHVNGYKIAKHTRVLANVWAIGRDPNIWEDPEKFQPQRFDGRGIDFRGQDFELIPFGAGRRICPGMQFSVAIVELAVANLVHRFDWKLPGGVNGEDMDMEESPGITCGKRSNLLVVATHCI